MHHDLSLPFNLFKAIALVFALSIAPLVIAQGQHSRVRIMTDGEAGGLMRLASLGLAVDHGQVKHGAWIETDLSTAEIAIARDNGFQCETLIADVSEWYRVQNELEPPARSKSDRSLCNAPGFYPLPSNFALGSMGGYFTWQEMLDILDQMRAAYPDLISAKDSIGSSHEGRPIHFLRISNDPETDQDKPEILYDALHHSREPASLSQLITFMWYLLEGYGNDPEVTYLLDHLELYFVPCINPDGYVYNETIAPEGGGMWRKNRRDNGDGTWGVDLNRNYGQGWGIDDTGSSPNPASEVYRGTGPFSEPETQVMRDFCNAHEFRMALNYHTYGNLLVYPWGYQPSFYTPDSAVFVNQGVVLTDENRYRFGTADQTVNYVVNGGSDDWMYGEQDTKPKIYSMTPEAGAEGEGFWPPEWRIPAICQENIGQNLRTAHLAGIYPRIIDRSPPVIDALDAYIPFEIQRLGVEDGTFTVSLEPLENVAFVGMPVALENLGMLESQLDSIEIGLDPAINDGDVFRFVIAVDNGAYTYRDTIAKNYGVPLVLFADDGSNLNNWENFGWGLSSTEWISAPSSVADSPFGNYPNNTNKRVTTLDEIDLTDATSATLTFHAKWDLEAFYDHVQIMASTDGTTWIPLCGKHTRAGSTFQDEDAPLYDGQQPNWVREEISLNTYLGETIKLRFQLISDVSANYDGFYWDDLAITVTGMGTIGMNANDPITLLPPQPNPAMDHTWITYAISDQGQNGHLLLFDAVGAQVRSVPLNGTRGSYQLNTSDLAAGVYSYTVTTGSMVAPLKKLMVVR